MTTAPLACPSCGGALTEDADTLTCECGFDAPVLGGVPVLVPDPDGWCTTHRDAALAAVAESGRDVDAALGALERHGARRRWVGRALFTDDWVARERGASTPRILRTSDAAAAFAQWIDAVRADPLEARMARDLGPVRRVLEIGCGAARLTERLVASGADVVAGDRSLRAALSAVDRGARGVVLEAEQLPVAEASLDAILAANVIDLLPDPVAMLESARRALRPGGELRLSTPDPALGTDEEQLVPLLDELGFDVDHVVDAHPWIRDHHGRHVEVYLVQIVTAHTR